MTRPCCITNRCAALGLIKYLGRKFGRTGGGSGIAKGQTRPDHQPPRLPKPNSSAQVAARDRKINNQASSLFLRTTSRAAIPFPFPFLVPVTSLPVAPHFRIPMLVARRRGKSLTSSFRRRLQLRRHLSSSPANKCKFSRNM